MAVNRALVPALRVSVRKLFLVNKTSVKHINVRTLSVASQLFQYHSRSSYGGDFRRKSRFDSDYEDDFDDYERSERRFRRPSSLGGSLKKKKWEDERLSEVNRSFYHPDKSTLERSRDEIETFWKENDISIIKGKNVVPNPIFDLEETGFFPNITNKMKKDGFVKPMPIQAQGWPIAMSSMDLVAIGQTGSGKTLGYLLPGIMHIKAQSEGSSGPIVLVMAPTRELAQQIDSVAQKYGKACGLQSVCCVGGTRKGDQIRNLMRGPEIVIGTPGRLIDLLQSGHLFLNSTSYVVLDEADRMLDMGFEPQIRQVFDQVRPDRQMLMWSATWPEEVQDLAMDFFNKDYVHLNIGSTELHANHNIKQIVKVIESSEKKKELMNFIKNTNEDTHKILIFTETKRNADFLSFNLERSGLSAASIHSDKSQMQRDRTLRAFRTGRVSILVATDVAARGLDIDDISLVINYDFPKCSEDYIHRIGRTGRRDKKGVAFTLFSHEDMNQARDLVKILEEANQDVDEELRAMSQYRTGKKKSFRNRGFDFNRPKNFRQRY